MTMDEVGKACGISAETLKYYQRLGLLEAENGSEALRRLGVISSLAKAGFTPEKLADNSVLFDESEETLDERVRIMKKERFRQLDDLHAKQQSLDCLDCIIREIKKGGCIGR